MIGGFIPVPCGSPPSLPAAVAVDDSDVTRWRAVRQRYGPLTAPMPSTTHGKGRRRNRERGIDGDGAPGVDHEAHHAGAAARRRRINDRRRTMRGPTASRMARRSPAPPEGEDRSGQVMDFPPTRPTTPGRPSKGPRQRRPPPGRRYRIIAIHPLTTSTFSAQRSASSAPRQGHRRCRRHRGRPLGDPYNDISTYLIELGHEAVAWLGAPEAAARRRPLPYFDLAHVYVGDARSRPIRDSTAIAIEPRSTSRRRGRPVARLTRLSALPLPPRPIRPLRPIRSHGLVAFESAARSRCGSSSPAEDGWPSPPSPSGHFSFCPIRTWSEGVQGRRRCFPRTARVLPPAGSRNAPT